MGGVWTAPLPLECRHAQEDFVCVVFRLLVIFRGGLPIARPGHPANTVQKPRVTPIQNGHCFQNVAIPQSTRMRVSPVFDCSVSMRTPIRVGQWGSARARSFVSYPPPMSSSSLQYKERVLYLSGRWTSYLHDLVFFGLLLRLAGRLISLLLLLLQTLLLFLLLFLLGQLRCCGGFLRRLLRLTESLLRHPNKHKSKGKKTLFFLFGCFKNTAC